MNLGWHLWAAAGLFRWRPFLHGGPLKIVACHFVSRFHPDSSLLVWAGALEYKGVQSVSCGAKAGLPADDLITEAIKNILCRLKEPVAIRLIASPALSDNVFGLLTTGRLDLRFSRERGADNSDLISGTVYISINVSTNHVRTTYLEKQSSGSQPPPRWTDQSSQLTTWRAGIRANSRALLVTRGNPNETAWAAISISMAPIGVPAFSRAARISP